MITPVPDQTTRGRATRQPHLGLVLRWLVVNMPLHGRGLLQFQYEK